MVAHVRGPHAERSVAPPVAVVMRPRRHVCQTKPPPPRWLVSVLRTRRLSHHHVSVGGHIRRSVGDFRAGAAARRPLPQYAHSFLNPAVGCGRAHAMRAPTDSASSP